MPVNLNRFNNTDQTRHIVSTKFDFAVFITKQTGYESRFVRPNLATDKGGYQKQHGVFQKEI